MAARCICDDLAVTWRVRMYLFPFRDSWLLPKLALPNPLDSEGPAETGKRPLRKSRSCVAGRTLEVVDEAERFGERPRVTANTARDPRGATLVAIAAQHGHLALLELLLTHHKTCDLGENVFADPGNGDGSLESRVFFTNANRRDAKVRVNLNLSGCFTSTSVRREAVRIPVAPSPDRLLPPPTTRKGYLFRQRELRTRFPRARRCCEHPRLVRPPARDAPTKRRVARWLCVCVVISRAGTRRQSRRSRTRSARSSC